LTTERTSRALTIVGLGGSLAEISRSRAALEVALEGAVSAGAETTLLDLRELDLPMYDPEVVRVAERFAADSSLHRAAECVEAAERVAAVR
jgi:NAD(P)H-dependent FMN reductase